MPVLCVLIPAVTVFVTNGGNLRVARRVSLVGVTLDWPSHNAGSGLTGDGQRLKICRKDRWSPRGNHHGGFRM